MVSKSSLRVCKDCGCVYSVDYADQNSCPVCKQNMDFSKIEDL